MSMCTMKQSRRRSLRLPPGQGLTSYCRLSGGARSLKRSTALCMGALGLRTWNYPRRYFYWPGRRQANQFSDNEASQASGRKSEKGEEDGIGIKVQKNWERNQDGPTQSRGAIGTTTGQT